MLANTFQTHSIHIQPSQFLYISLDHLCSKRIIITAIIYLFVILLVSKK